ncbi:MAG: hypothetical protein QQW96_01555 [Tychonema bourrellyi B0820]|nr:hypothetical protein [Tychonema bourrellyi B0820]
MWNRHLACFWAGSPAHPTRYFNVCGTGILPVFGLNFDRQLHRNWHSVFIQHRHRIHEHNCMRDCGH